MPDTMPTDLQHSHLRRLYTTAEEVAHTVAAFPQRYDAEALLWQPAAGRWSIAECVQHLTLTDRAYLEPLERAIAAAPPADEVPAFKPSLFARLFHAFVKPDPRLKVPTMPAMDPSTVDLNVEAVFADFADHQGRMFDLLQRAEGTAFHKQKFASPFTRFVRFTIGEGLWILISHQQRHLQQAQRVAQTDGFPG